MIKKINFIKETEVRKNSKNIINDVFIIDNHLEMLEKLNASIPAQPRKLAAVLAGD